MQLHPRCLRPQVSLSVLLSDSPLARRCSYWCCPQHRYRICSLAPAFPGVGRCHLSLDCCDTPPPLHPHLFSAEQPERPCETKVSPPPLHSPPTQGSHPVRNKSHILSTGLARPPDCGPAFTSHLFSCSSHSSQAGLRAGPRASRHGPASGPLHLLFLWPRMLFP